ncbi:MAG: DUF3783 domain-containing protein [Spirochaetia bacterium]|nr:DUF3783 domain-containing protein [Spirochaetia bacterium]
MSMSTKQQKVVIAHGFDKDEILRLMRAVKNEFTKEVDIAFAMTTENSLKRNLGEVVLDISGDHQYLKENPPNIKKES